MGTRDEARLTAEERTAFASLEAAAAAADPQLSAQLRGRADLPLSRVAAGAARAVGRWWRSTLGRAWLAAVLVPLGLFVAVAGLTAGLAVGVAGAVLAAVGLRVAAEGVATKRAGGRSART